MREIEKIDIDKLSKGNDQFTVPKIIYLAEKINEIIDSLPSKKESNPQ